jgi:hypothetical protein
MSRVTVTELRRAGHCASGIRRWFEAHDLDFRDFLKNGIEEETLRQTGDGQVLMALDQIKARRCG